MHLTIITDDEDRVTEILTEDGKRVVNIARVAVTFDPTSGPWPRPTVEVELHVWRSPAHPPANYVTLTPSEAVTATWSFSRAETTHLTIKHI